MLVDDDEDCVSRLNLSEIALSCDNGGRIICTSGSGQVGSTISATLEALSTLTGTSCVTVVFPLARIGAENRDEEVIVAIVRQRTGAPSDGRFVNRIETSDAEYAERSAR